jgi:hypothetical protein
MLTVRLATAPDPAPMPGILRVELEGLSSKIPISLQMPAPGFAIVSPPLPTPTPPPGQVPTFQMLIAYFLGDRSVRVNVSGVGLNDSLNIFASRLDQSPTGAPGVLYVGKIIHSNHIPARNCGVQCEHGSPTFEECCVICRDGNIVTETCC